MILIIGILASVIVPKMVTMDKRAKERTTLMNLKAIRKAIELYVADNGDVPPPLADLGYLVPTYLAKIPPNLLVSDISKRTAVAVSPGYNDNVSCDFCWKNHPALDQGWYYHVDVKAPYREHKHTNGGYCQYGIRLVTIGYPDGVNLDCDGKPYYEW